MSARGQTRAWPFVVMGLVVLWCMSGLAEAATGFEAFTVKPAPGGGETYTLSLRILVMMTALTLLPAVLMMMTSFTRIVIVLAILRQALGTAQTPPNQILLGLALFLTFFIMSPVIEKIHAEAVTPWMEEKISDMEAVTRARGPLQEFMLTQTREADLALFARLRGDTELTDPASAPFSIVAPAFITSELKTAFQIGFLIFIPFLIIDLVVASVLMAMGMMMLSPQTVSFPFKLMLFVLVDGWGLLIGTLAASFATGVGT